MFRSLLRGNAQDGAIHRARTALGADRELKRYLFLIVAAALLLSSENWPDSAPPAPLAGFSYSPLSSEYSGRDPARDLSALLDATQPDLVRLPVYWDSVEPTPDRLDFSEIDSLLKAVAKHNHHSSIHTRVVLTIGARNFLYPELHMPVGAGDREQPNLDEVQQGYAYRAYIDTTITRYRGSHLLYAWQVENEPFDYVANELTGDDRITPSQLGWEVGEVHRLDPGHQALLTTYNGVNLTIDMMQLWTPVLGAQLGRNGHPQESLQVGDALGLDLYVDGPSVPYRHVTSVDLRAEWKEQTVAFWADRARAKGKDLWVAEMQAQPWSGEGAFSTSDLMATAADYRQEQLQVVLLWGVETWLEDPGWMSAAAQAMSILRAR